MRPQRILLPSFSLLAACLTSAAAQFHDDFRGASPDPAWTWSDPGNDCSYKLGGGRLRMTVPVGNDHTTGHGAPLYAGPMLTVPATGDFVVTTYVEVNYPTAPSTMESGLMIWKDRSNNLQFKRTNGFNSQNVLMYGNLGRSQTTQLVNFRLTANALYLRIARAGQRFTASVSTDGISWTVTGTATWSVTGALQVGIATSYWLWFGTAAGPAFGDYGFFDLQPAGVDFAADRAGFSALAGGTIGLRIDAGAAHATEGYIMVGSLSGSSPGIPLPGGTLPLNWDLFSDLMLAYRNLAGVFPGTAGVLDAAGQARGAVIVPPGAAVPLVGASLRFAAVTYPPSGWPLRPTAGAGVAIVR